MARSADGALNAGRPYSELARISMSDLRARTGEIVDQVLRGGQIFVVERKGKPLACLVPVEDVMLSVAGPRWSQELDALEKADEVFSVGVSEKREIIVRVPERPGETGASIEVVLPHRYPNVPPVVHAAPIDESAPHRFPNGTLCVFGLNTRWNPGQHDVIAAIGMARQWLRNYNEWRRIGEWPAPTQ